MTEQNFLIIITAIIVAAAAGYLGSFMILKRMSLVGDALSHVALPGMAIAITLGYSPILGAFAALTLAIIGIWYLQETSNLYPETLVGIFFTTALAIGVLITPEPDLLEALFGSIEKIQVIEALVAIILSLITIFITKNIAKKLILGIISEDMAKSVGINGSVINLIYLLLVGTIVALGVRFVGTLLMGALVIIPAASARNISHGINNYYLLSILFGILSAIIGIIIAIVYNISSGPIVVLVSIFFFILSYIAKLTNLTKD